MIRITSLEDFWSHGSNWFKSWFRKHSKKTRSKFLNMMNSSSLMEVVLASLKPSKSRCQKLSLYFGEIRKVFSSYFVCWKPIWFTLVSWRSVVSGYWWMMPRVITRSQLLPCSLPRSWWRGDFDYDENFLTMWNWLCNENFLSGRYELPCTYLQWPQEQDTPWQRSLHSKQCTQWSKVQSVKITA